MKMREQTIRQNRIYHFQAELESIKHDMSDAMQKAHVPYVKEGRQTLHMQMALGRFYDWARRMSDAGLQ